MGVIRDIVVEIESMINDYKSLNTKYLDVNEKFTELKGLIKAKTGVVEYDIDEIKRRLEYEPYTAVEFLNAKNKETAVFDVPYIPAYLCENSGTLANISFKQPTIIYDYAFENCRNLQTVDFTNVTQIKSCAFSRSGISGDVVLSDATSIEEDAFEDCVNITSITANKLATFHVNKIRSEMTNLKELHLAGVKGISLPPSYVYLPEIELIDLPNVETVKGDIEILKPDF